MNNKMKLCNTCQKEIASSAKVCPECGAKQKKPVYKKWWFWTIIAVVIIAVAAGGDSTSTNNESTTDTQSQTSTVTENNTADEKEEITYEEVSVNKMMEDLEGNALSAANTYKNKNLQITGRLAVIDSNGKYFSLFPDDQFAFIGVQCFMKNDDQKNHIATLTKDQAVTVKVKITNVGEVLGYSANLIEFVE